jgi:hypothetical protein
MEGRDTFVILNGHPKEGVVLSLLANIYLNVLEHNVESKEGAGKVRDKSRKICW